MLKVGLTGSMAAGKSTVADMFARFGVPVFSADDAVHALYAPGGAAVAPVLALFPEAADGRGGVDRAALAGIIRERADALPRLEAIVHPLVEQARKAFLADAAHAGAPCVIFEIPLLFETGAEAGLDVIIAVTAPEAQRRARALRRLGMSEEKFAHLQGRQLSDTEKCTRADFIIDTSGSLEDTRRQVRDIHQHLLRKAGASGEN